MPNHVHLVLESGPTHLSAVMHRIGTTYAKYFNGRHDRVGHVFQGRFASWAVRAPEHLEALLRYVPLNPLTGGVVESADALRAHRWTSLHEVLRPSGPLLLDRARVLRWFGAAETDAVDAYVAHVLAGTSDALAAGQLVLGVPRRLTEARAETRHDRPEPVEADPRDADSTFVARRTARQRRWRARMLLRCAGWTVESSLAWSCRQMGARPAAVLAGRRTGNASRARALAALVACEVLGASKSDAARRLGVSLPAIARCMARGWTVLDDLRARPRLLRAFADCLGASASSTERAALLAELVKNRS